MPSGEILDMVCKFDRTIHKKKSGSLAKGLDPPNLKFMLGVLVITCNIDFPYGKSGGVLHSMMTNETIRPGK